MLSFYLIIFTFLGGFIALFLVAGWNSYKEGKLPDKQVLFQWFLAGFVSSGLATYAWLFGAGGDPIKVFQSILDNLGAGAIFESIKSTIGGGMKTQTPIPPLVQETLTNVILEPAPSPEKYKAKQIEITIGMPNF